MSEFVPFAMIALVFVGPWIGLILVVFMLRRIIRCVEDQALEIADLWERVDGADDPDPGDEGDHAPASSNVVAIGRRAA